MKQCDNLSQRSVSAEYKGERGQKTIDKAEYRFK